MMARVWLASEEGIRSSVETHFLEVFKCCIDP